jgi:UDP-glucuronate 4-epimerase
MTLLVTGAAGFIGFHTTQRLLERGDFVVGIDNLNAYYDVTLKHDRLAQLKRFPNFNFIQMDIVDREAVGKLFSENSFSKVVHLAAQAGVRHSLTDPFAYIDTNLAGFGNILEGCRRLQLEHLVFASSSSVYGANTQYPLDENHNTDHPLSLYAATKKANELIAHSYAHLYQLPCTGLRFFTVYGPWGRPDMALFKFAKNILSEEPIEVYHHGEMVRDFTYISDIVEGIILSLDQPAQADAAWSSEDPNSASSKAPYRIYNIGRNKPVPLLEFIQHLEKALGKKAIIEWLPLQPGDVLQTYASTERLADNLNYQPKIDVPLGIQNFVDWYLPYHRAKK